MSRRIPKMTMTVWSHPDEIVNSGHGNVTYRRWCELELERINKGERKAHLVTNANGEIAISR